VLRNVAETAAKYSTVTEMEALEVSDGHASAAGSTRKLRERGRTVRQALRQAATPRRR
jgi:hypothetical protein